MTNSWKPTDWQKVPVKQIPPYPDTDALQKSVDQLSKYPPLVTSWEVENLKAKLAKAAEGKAFLLQGGDCAETFDSCEPGKLVNQIKVMLQMSMVLIHEIKLPVIRVGRLAGQYAKPRSNAMETVEGKDIPIYRGDLFNGFDASAESRAADPNRLIQGYHTAALTLNFIRALTDGGGFADLHHPEFWELEFMKDHPFSEEYSAIVNSMSNAIKFVEIVSPDKLVTLKRVHMFTSHEALNLYYEQAQTRQVPHKQGWFNLSAHMVWLGNRTRGIDDGHVEYLRGIQNPIGIKFGEPYDGDEFVSLIEKLNPSNEKGKIVIISRFGAGKVANHLPEMIRRIQKEGLNVLWVCDPMHGNTYSAKNGIKTRDFEAILSELKETFEIHRAEGSIMGGVHFELTGENVTECVGGTNGMSEEELPNNYQSLCDPRLNYKQSMEMAFMLAKTYKESYSEEIKKRDAAPVAAFMDL